MVISSSGVGIWRLAQLGDRISPVVFVSTTQVWYVLGGTEAKVSVGLGRLQDRGSLTLTCRVRRCLAVELWLCGSVGSVVRGWFNVQT